MKPEHVRFELFTSGKPDRPEGNIGRPVVADESKETYKITFKLDGLQGEVASPTHARESILNAALRVRPDVPFACAGGVCGTCRAKVVTGTVTMDENYALEQDELDKGYVLTCQSPPHHPGRHRRLRRLSPSCPLSTCHARSPMISLSIDGGIAEVVLNAPHKLNAARRAGAGGTVPGVRRRRCRRLAR